MHCVCSLPLALGNKKECSFLIANFCTIGTCETQIPLNGNGFITYLFESDVSSPHNMCEEVTKDDSSLEN